MRFDHGFEVAAPRERVFDHLTDHDKVRQWAKGTEERTYLTPPPHGAGTRFRQRIREGGQVQDYEGEILALEPPGRLRTRLSRGPITMEMEYRLSGTPAGGTRVDQTLAIEAASLPMRIMMRLAAPLTRHLMRRQARALAAMAEAHQSAGAG